LVELIRENRSFSLNDFRPNPSAIFDVIEIALQRNWLVSPNTSYLGKSCVIL